jgi:23S rRNA (guanosine2251-2'-O)-methyltransferase
VILILHNIRSVHNVGSIFRTADAAGVECIILSGYTPTPLDRFNQPRRDFAKVSLGAEVSVPWSQVTMLGPTLAKLQRQKYLIAAIEQDERSSPLFSYYPPKGQPLALILGNEVRGISQPLLKKCDVILEIPMRGKKESLNVSVTAGIALFALLHKK